MHTVIRRRLVAFVLMARPERGLADPNLPNLRPIDDTSRVKRRINLRCQSPSSSLGACDIFRTCAAGVTACFRFTAPLPILGFRAMSRGSGKTPSEALTVINRRPSVPGFLDDAKLPAFDTWIIKSVRTAHLLWLS
jgi:hypothetical protein